MTAIGCAPACGRLCTYFDPALRQRLVLALQRRMGRNAQLKLAFFALSVPARPTGAHVYRLWKARRSTQAAPQEPQDHLRAARSVSTAQSGTSRRRRLIRCRSASPSPVHARPCAREDARRTRVVLRKNDLWSISRQHIIFLAGRRRRVQRELLRLSGGEAVCR
jgi:hypothetical protein